MPDNSSQRISKIVIDYLPYQVMSTSHAKRNTSQWIEAGGDPENILRIHRISQISNSEIGIEMANGGKRIIRVPPDDLE